MLIRGKVAWRRWTVSLKICLLLIRLTDKQRSTLSVGTELTCRCWGHTGLPWFDGCADVLSPRNCDVAWGCWLLLLEIFVARLSAAGEWKNRRSPRPSIWHSIRWMCQLHSDIWERGTDVVSLIYDLKMATRLKHNRVSQLWHADSEADRKIDYWRRERVSKVHHVYIVNCWPSDWWYREVAVSHCCTCLRVDWAALCTLSCW